MNDILSRQPPAFPCRLQHSIIGRLGLNHRVRDENGCVPYAHRHQNLYLILLLFYFALLLTPLTSYAFAYFGSAVRLMAYFVFTHPYN